MGLQYNTVEAFGIYSVIHPPLSNSNLTIPCLSTILDFAINLNPSSIFVNITSESISLLAVILLPPNNVVYSMFNS